MTRHTVRCLDCKTSGIIENYFCGDDECDGHLKSITDTVFIFPDPDGRLSPRCKGCGAVMYESVRYIQ